MRNKRFIRHAESLNKKDQVRFSRKVSKMTPKEKQVLNDNIDYISKEVKYQAGGLFSPQDLYVPVVDGQEVTYADLVPVDQQAILVRTEDQGRQQVRPRRRSTKKASNNRLSVQEDQRTPDENRAEPTVEDVPRVTNSPTDLLQRPEALIGTDTSLTDVEPIGMNNGEQVFQDKEGKRYKQRDGKLYRFISGLGNSPRQEIQRSSTFVQQYVMPTTVNSQEDYIKDRNNRNFYRREDGTYQQAPETSKYTDLSTYGDNSLIRDANGDIFRFDEQLNDFVPTVLNNVNNSGQSNIGQEIRPHFGVGMKTSNDREFIVDRNQNYFVWDDDLGKYIYKRPAYTSSFYKPSTDSPLLQRLEQDLDYITRPFKETPIIKDVNQFNDGTGRSFKRGGKKYKR